VTEFLHIADSASHAGLGGLVTWVAAAVGVAAGAFVVFGLPAIIDRKRARESADVARRDGPE
jgi:hypothetical protein